MEKFIANLDNLHQMLDYIINEAIKVGFETPEVVRLQLASEEALTNVIKYAYPEVVGELEIECGVKSGEDFFYITIKDEGEPFNPLEESEDVDIEAEAEERRIGGLGVLMMKIIMDNLNYERRGTANVLVMKKKNPEKSLH